MEGQAGREVGRQTGRRAVGRAGRLYKASSHFPNLRKRLKTNNLIFSEVVYLRHSMFRHNSVPQESQ